MSIKLCFLLNNNAFACKGLLESFTIKIFGNYQSWAVCLQRPAGTSADEVGFILMINGEIRELKSRRLLCEYRGRPTPDDLSSQAGPQAGRREPSCALTARTLAHSGAHKQVRTAVVGLPQ